MEPPELFEPEAVAGGPLPELGTVVLADPYGVGHGLQVVVAGRGDAYRPILSWRWALRQLGRPSREDGA